MGRDLHWGIMDVVGSCRRLYNDGIVCYYISPNRKTLTMTISHHAICILVLLALYLAFQAGKHFDDRRKRKERERIWKREQARLPKAIKTIVPIICLSVFLTGCTKTQPTYPARVKKKCTCMPYPVPRQGHADTLELYRG